MHPRLEDLDLPWEPTASPRQPPPRADASASVRDRQAERALTVLTVDASPPGGTGAAAGHRVTHCSLPAPAHVGTARTEAALWTACREERGRWPALPAPLLCATSPRDRMGCSDVPAPAPAHPGISPPPAARLEARPALPSRSPSQFPKPVGSPHDSGKGAVRGGTPSWPPSAQRSTSPRGVWGGGTRAGDTEVTGTPSTSAQPGAKHSGRIQKTDGQRAVLPASWLGPHPRGPGSSHILPPQPLTQAAVCPQEAGRTEAGPGGCVTEGPVRTPTALLTARPKPPRRAPCRDTGRCQRLGVRPGALASHPQPWDEQPLPRTAQRALPSTALPGGVWAGVRPGPAWRGRAQPGGRVPP
uniref:Uncharacterized protein n=1 Tax=Mustela putorius furo TaxID=9669 RepID=M3Z8W3_MUSPF